MTFSLKGLLLGIAVLPALTIASTTTTTMTNVDLSGYANCRVQYNCYQWPAPAVEQAPEGPVTLGGVPFNLQTVGGYNGWSGAATGTLTLSVNIANPTTVYTLINTGAGTYGPATNIAIEFKGSGGAYYAKVLVGGVDVRSNTNYCYIGCTNSINGTTTTNVVDFSLGGYDHRLDMQAITLPPEFQSQSLTQITLLDWAAPGIGQFAVLAGVTVASTSNPVAPPVTTVKVDFSNYANCRLQYNCFYPIDDPAYPEGTLTLGGVPFNIGPVGGTNAWWAQAAVRDTNTRLTSLQIPVNIPNPIAVHTLINTAWGQAGGPYASIEFFGNAGGYYKKDLYGNLDIRTNSNYTPVSNTCCIDNLSTVNVYSDPPGWAPGGWNTFLDMQTITLPAGLQNQTLTQIVLNDWGGMDFQAVTLAGLTVDVSPTSTTAATTTTASTPPALIYSPTSQNITLNATVTSTSTVNSGTVSFTLLGTSVSASVTGGFASTSFTVVGGTVVANYTIQATYNPGAGLAASSDNGKQLTIGKATPVISWSNPADILFGTALGPTQLNATCNVLHGIFIYNPPAGSVLPVGNSQTLSVKFAADDETDYTAAIQSVQINVKPTSPPASPVQIVVTKLLSRNSSTQQVVVSLNITNAGGTNAQNVQLTVGKIGSTSGTSLPQALGTVAAGTTATTTLTFPGTVGTSGSLAALTVSGTYTGGSFSSASRVTLP